MTKDYVKVKITFGIPLTKPEYVQNEQVKRVYQDLDSLEKIGAISGLRIFEKV